MNKLLQYLKKATLSPWAIGAFNIQNLETLQAVVEATIDCNSPAIISISEGALKYANEYIVALFQTAKTKNTELFLPRYLQLRAAQRPRNFCKGRSAFQSGGLRKIR